MTNIYKIDNPRQAIQNKRQTAAFGSLSLVPGRQVYRISPSDLGLSSINQSGWQAKQHPRPSHWIGSAILVKWKCATTKDICAMAPKQMPNSPQDCPIVLSSSDCLEVSSKSYVKGRISIKISQSLLHRLKSDRPDFLLSL
jgi:hypothetical protein